MAVVAGHSLLPRHPDYPRPLFFSEEKQKEMSTLYASLVAAAYDVATGRVGRVRQDAARAADLLTNHSHTVNQPNTRSHILCDVVVVGARTFIVFGPPLQPLPSPGVSSI